MSKTWEPFAGLVFSLVLFGVPLFIWFDEVKAFLHSQEWLVRLLYGF